MESDEYLAKAWAKEHEKQKDEHYCGFSCSEIKEKQQAIIDELIDFNKHNPEYSMVMLGKLMEMLYESKQEMLRSMEPIPTT